jgi:localization factor PodJL
MARAYRQQELPASHDPQPGEWQALRGELVALLDQVEGRLAPQREPEPGLSGLAQRMRHLRDQVEGPEPTLRRREALRTVKRAVDRFSDRDEQPTALENDALTDAIAEIRGRQMSGSAAALGSRPADMPEFRELGRLVGGISDRLGWLESELKSQRSGKDGVREVAAQVEQLTHVVELLAGAVGETGQVKRLEAQIAALGAMIEDTPRVDLGAVNKRLDDVSATVGKLAELQVQQMEREILREERAAIETVDTASMLTPAMQSIEENVRAVYDRIDAIERNTAISSADFERLTEEMAAFSRAMQERDMPPGKLVAKVDALAARIADFEGAGAEIGALQQDVGALRDAVLAGMQPHFQRIEDRIDALSEKMVPADTGQVESQLKLLMQRMNETGAQLDGLTKLYSSHQGEPADLEAMATLVAERTSEAVTRKAPAPVAMFGPDSLKSIEDRLAGLIKTAGKAPDLEKLATLVAEKTSEAVSKASPAPQSAMSDDGMEALEQRMASLFNTAGKETAERLTRLEAALAARQERAPDAPAAPRREAAPAKLVTERDGTSLDAMLSALSSPSATGRSDSMPANPADDAPLVDPGFKQGPIRAALEAKTHNKGSSASTAPQRPEFDLSTVEPPPRPQSSFQPAEADPFAAPPPPPAAAAPLVAPAPNSTSTFVAAARRAQQARQETPAPAASGNSLISRALSRVMPGQAAVETKADDTAAPAEKPAKSKKPAKEKQVKQPKAPATAAPVAGMEQDAPQQPNFLVRHRRPLLLAATLVAVSMLALNLVMQRANEPQLTTPAPLESVAPAPAPVSPELSSPVEPAADAAEEVSLVAPEPRVIDMVDSTETASINPSQRMSFSQAVAETPMPPTLFASTSQAPLDPVPAEVTPAVPVGPAPEFTGSIPPASEPAEPFELPPEALGPTELRQAAADGDARAQFEVGAIFTEGRAVPQDQVEAAKWYERAAAQGFAPAQYRLGNLYEAGQGVEQDLEVAKLWYQRSAEAGNRMAMHNLAALYASGQLGEQEFEAAAEWFEKAADRGMTDSQFNLGMLYARGLGVVQDFEQSYKWFALAAIAGDGDAGKARDDIAKSLNAAAVSRLDDEVATWQAQPIDLAVNYAPLGTWSDSFDPGEAITSKDVVARVQQALTKLGFDVGTPDGLAGPKTIDAIKSFERATGMSESGTINPRLLAVLGSQPV